MNNSTSSDSLSLMCERAGHESDVSSNWSTILTPFILLVYAIIFAKIYRRHQYKMEPVHILELNSYMDLFIWGTFGEFGLGNMKKFLIDTSLFCNIINLIEIVSRFSWHADMTAASVDRFLAIYWSASYKERVTTSKAVNMTIFIKMMMILLSCVVGYNNPSILNCSPQDCGPPVCSSMRTSNFFMATIPGSVSLLSIIIVTVYVVKIIIKHQSQVTPIVNIPPADSVFSVEKHLQQQQQHKQQHHLQLEEQAGPSINIQQGKKGFS